MSTLNNPDIVSVSKITESWTCSVGPLMEVDMNTINSRPPDIYYIHYFNINNGGFLENGLSLFNIDGVSDGDFMQLDGVSDDDFTQCIDYKEGEEYAEYTGLIHYISQHATSNVEVGSILSVHKFPTRKLLGFITSWLNNYGEAGGANPMDVDDGADQRGHDYREISNTYPTSVHPRGMPEPPNLLCVMRCSNDRVACRTNGETYHPSTTTHPSASVLLEPSHGPTYASYLCISPSTISAVVTQHRLIRLLTQRHDNHHLLTPVAVWGDVINVYASTADSFWVIHNDAISPNVALMRIGHRNMAAHFVLSCLTHAQENQGCSTGGVSDICEDHLIGGWIDIHRCFSANVPCVKNGEIPSIGINAYSLRLVNSPTEFCDTSAHYYESSSVYLPWSLQEHYHIVSFEEGVEPTLIRQRNHAILLWGDYSFTSGSISTQDPVVVDIKQIRFYGDSGCLPKAISQFDCYESLWNAHNIFLPVTGQDDYMRNVSTCRILLVIEDTDSWVCRCESAIFCEDCIGLETSPIIQGPTASISVVHRYEDSTNSSSTIKIFHPHHDRSHRCASCFGLEENGSQRDFLQKHPHGYGQLQVSTALQLAVDTSCSVYI
eukprot:scaffold16231_cov87-Skeletonema_dohrnii-CCMP3373.AAC.2